MYVNTTAEVKAETDYCCTSSNAVQVVEHIYREHGHDTEILFGPDMFLGRLRGEVDRRKDAGLDGRVPRARRHPPLRLQRMRDEHPGADFLIHPECGCTTSVMEYVSAGDIDAENTHMLSTGGMLDHARESDAEAFIVATETGMLHPLEEANPGKSFIPPDRKAVCQYMKMITLPKLRDALRDLSPVRATAPRPHRRARAGADRAHGGHHALRASFGARSDRRSRLRASR